VSTVKTHFESGSGAACGNKRARRGSSVLRYVDCIPCQESDAYANAYAARQAALEAEFQAQTPRQVRKMWGGTGNYECYACGGDLFRERPRSLFSYNFVCEGCGTTISPPTETGMST
jgi:hypothetical protein